MATDTSWRTALSTILDSTEQNLRITALGAGTYPSTVLSKVVQHNHSCEAQAAKAEFSSLLKSVQGSLAELRLEVAAVRQLSSNVTTSWPSTRIVSPIQYADRHLHEQYTTPFIPAKHHAAPQTASEMSNPTQFAKLQQQVQNINGSLQQLEASQDLASSSNSSSIAQLHRRLEQAEQEVQRLQAEGMGQTDQALQQQLQSGQHDDLPQQLHSSRQQVQQSDFIFAKRVDKFEQQLQVITQALGMPIAQSLQAQPAAHPVSTVAQQLHDLHAAVALLAQAQQQATPEHETRSQDKWQKVHAQLQCDVQQLQTSTSSIEDSTADLQQSLAAQQHVNAALQQQYQQLTSDMQSLKAQQAEQAQHAREQFAAQSSSAQDLSRQLQNQDAQLDNLNAVAAQHGEQLQSQAADLSRHADRLHAKAAKLAQQDACHHDQMQAMAQHAESIQTLDSSLAEHAQQLERHAVALRQHDQQLGAQQDGFAKLQEQYDSSSTAHAELQDSVISLEQQHASARQSPQEQARQAERVLERLSTLEAEQAHSATANEAMSGIIDQVAQLAEQQVQGCNLRVSRLETDLAQRTDTLRHQQDTHTSALSSFSAQLADLQSSLEQTSSATASGEVATNMSQLQTNVKKMQAGFADVSKATHSQQEMSSTIAELQREVKALQQSVAVLSTHDESIMSLKSQVQDLLLVADAVHAGQEGRQQLTARVGEVSEHLMRLQLEMKQACSAASDPQSNASVSGLHHELMSLKTQVGGLQTAAADKASVQVQIAELHNQVRELELAAKSQANHASANDIKQDVAALKAQLSQLQANSAKQASDKDRQQDMQSVKSELAECSKVSRTAEAAVAELAVQLKQAAQQLTALQDELASKSQGAGASESTHPVKAAAEQIDAEELNERLFELRVEVQNLADDTSISVASISRKAELAEQHAEEAAEAAAALKQVVTQMHSSSQQAQPDSRNANLQAADQPHQQHAELLQQQQKAQQQQLDKLASECTELQASLEKLRNTVANQSGQAEQAQQAAVQRVTGQCSELAVQMKAAQSRLDSHALHGATQEQQQEAQHAEVQRQVQTVKQQAQQAQQQVQTVQEDLKHAAAQRQALQEGMQGMQANVHSNTEKAEAVASKVEACSSRIKAAEQAMHGKAEQQGPAGSQEEVKVLIAASHKQQQQLSEVQSRVEAVCAAVATASATASSSCGKLEQKVSALQAEVAQHAQHDVEATKQHLTSLEGQLHTQAAELAQLAARQSQASATEQSAAGDATLKQRLRKVELTVADALVEVASQMKALEAKVSAMSSLQPPTSSASGFSAASQTSQTPSSVPASNSNPASTAAAHAAPAMPVVTAMPAESQSSRGAPSQTAAPVAASAPALQFSLDDLKQNNAAAAHAVPAGPKQAGMSQATSGKAAPSSVPAAMPDLISFSPAVKGPAPVTPTVVHAAQPAVVLVPHSNATAATVSSQGLPGAQVQAVSSKPSVGIFDDAVFGSPTPTPSPQPAKMPQINPEHSLLSPGSSPEQHAQQLHQQQQQLPPSQHSRRLPPLQPQAAQQQPNLPMAAPQQPSAAPLSTPVKPQQQLPPSRHAADSASQQASIGAGASILQSQHRSEEGQGRQQLAAALPVPAAAQGQDLSHATRGAAWNGGASGPPQSSGTQANHSPNISLGHNFGSGVQGLLDDTDAESSVADEEEVAHQVKVIEDQLARNDVNEWERDILMSELDLLNNTRNSRSGNT